MYGPLVRLQHPLRTDAIPLVADSEGVDPQMGTGAVKITPSHDANDFQVGQRLGLPTITMLDEKGLVCFPNESQFRLTPDGEKFLVSFFTTDTLSMICKQPLISNAKTN